MTKTLQIVAHAAATPQLIDKLPRDRRFMRPVSTKKCAQKPTTRVCFAVCIAHRMSAHHNYMRAQTHHQHTRHRWRFGAAHSRKPRNGIYARINVRYAAAVALPLLALVIRKSSTLNRWRMCR